MNQSNLKQDLLNVESAIKAITGNDIEYMSFWWRNDEKCEKVKTLLHQRRTLLNKMFLATPSEIVRFKQVNEMLYRLTSQLFNRVKKLSNSHKIISDPTLDDDYEIDGTLRVVVESETDILTLDNDDYYGSDFLLMNHILYLIYDGHNSDIEWFNADVISNEEKPMCDDGVSWNEYPFYGRKEFDDIVICHAVHDICNHKKFSIPDLLRINSYWAETKLTLQKFASQK
ncbi:MAG: hypothetical protein IKL35_01255 [Muribaculaceae bacterium]|nr:hypothetical protein [Muribaculaceae bacterium]